MIKQIALVGLGGALGSILRFLTIYISAKWIPSLFPVGTFTVNIVGSLILGFVLGLIAINRPEVNTDNLRLLVGVGFCGGFTTFSTFSYENISFLQDGNYLHFASYTFISLVVGFLAVIFGLWLSRYFI